MSEEVISDTTNTHSKVLTLAEIEEIEARCGAFTEEPWERFADFVALARTGLPRLCVAYRQRLEEWEAMLMKVRQIVKSYEKTDPNDAYSCAARYIYHELEGLKSNE